MFDLIGSYFNSSGFLYENSSQIQVLTEKDEIIDSWITVNYFSRLFTIVILDSLFFLLMTDARIEVILKFVSFLKELK